MSVAYDSLFIGAEWVASGETTLVSASAEKVLGHVPEATRAHVGTAVAAARDAFDKRSEDIAHSASCPEPYADRGVAPARIGVPGDVVTLREGGRTAWSPR